MSREKEPHMNTSSARATDALFFIPSQERQGKNPKNIALLAILLAHGKEILVQQNGAEEAREAIRELFLPFSNCTELTENPFIQTGVRLAFLRILATKQPPKGGVLEALIGELVNLFPDAEEGFVTRLVIQFQEFLRDPALSFEKKRREDEANLREVIETARNAVGPYTEKIQPRNLGTETFLIPCHACGINKRCDRRTRRFRCKVCGFEASFRDGKIVTP